MSKRLIMRLFRQDLWIIKNRIPEFKTILLSQNLENIFVILQMIIQPLTCQFFIYTNAPQACIKSKKHWLRSKKCCTILLQLFQYKASLLSLMKYKLIFSQILATFLHPYQRPKPPETLLQDENSSIKDFLLNKDNKMQLVQKLLKKAMQSWNFTQFDQLIVVWNDLDGLSGNSA